MRCRAGKRREREGDGEREREKGDGTRRRSAQPPITRCQRRQAVIRRLNSRNSRSVFVRVNLHQVSIFRAFRCDARRGEARRGEVMRCERRECRRRLRSETPKGKKHRHRATVINNTSKNNGENIGNGRPNVVTVKDNSTKCLTHIGKYVNDKFSYDAYRENECQSAFSVLRAINYFCN